MGKNTDSAKSAKMISMMNFTVVWLEIYRYVHNRSIYLCRMDSHPGNENELCTDDSVHKLQGLDEEV